MTVEIIAYFSSKCCFQVRETGWSAQLLKKFVSVCFLSKHSVEIFVAR